jgi:hypothetical protein
LQAIPARWNRPARLGNPENSEAQPLTLDDKEILEAYVGGELKRRAATSSAIDPDDYAPQITEKGPE